MTSIEIIGHVTLDNIVTRKKFFREILGGPPSYGGLALASLGVKVYVTTRLGRDFPEKYLKHLKSKLILNEPYYNETTTRFLLDYTVDPERIVLLSSSAKISPITSTAGIVMVSPTYHEVDVTEIPRLAKQSLVSVDIQGFVRKNIGDGRIIVSELGTNILEIIAKATIVRGNFVEIRALTGEADIEKCLKTIVRKGVEVAISTARNEVKILCSEGFINLRVPPLEGVCPTGAGDVFTAYFTYEYARSYDAYKAALLGLAGSRITVKTVGPSKVDVDELLTTYRMLKEGVEIL